MWNMPAYVYVCLMVAFIAGIVGIQVFDRMSREKDSKYFAAQYAMLDLIRMMQ